MRLGSGGLLVQAEFLKGGSLGFRVKRPESRSAIHEEREEGRGTGYVFYYCALKPRTLLLDLFFPHLVWPSSRFLYLAALCSSLVVGLGAGMEATFAIDAAVTCSQQYHCDQRFQPLRGSMPGVPIISSIQTIGLGFNI